MQITWWEYAELLEHLKNRPDLWETDGTMWVRKSEETAAFALQFLPPQETGPYRMYSLFTTEVTWSDEEIQHYLERLCYFWTSYSTRLEFTQLLTSELKLDPQTSWLMSIALMRASVEPKSDPELTSPPPRVQHLWSDVPGEVAWKDVQGVIGDVILPLNKGGYVSLAKHHEMLRISVDVVNPYPANGPHSFHLSGFVKPHGYSIGAFLDLMNRRKQEVLKTVDPDSQRTEGYETILDTTDNEQLVFNGPRLVGGMDEPEGVGAVPRDETESKGDI